MSHSLENLAQTLRDFAAERDWDQFHSPKNLAMALIAEAGELAAEFQWMKESESLAPDPHKLARIQSEAADVTLYLVRLADKLGFDLLEVATEKIEQNRIRYPAGKAHGNSKKYTEF